MENNYNNYEPYVSQGGEQGQDTVIQSVMSKTFLFMCAALLISALSAFATYQSDLVYTIASNRILFYGLLFGEIGIVMVASRAIEKQRIIPATLLFAAYACINGVTLSFIFLIYEIGSIFSIFIVSALVFGVMAVYGYVTKSDLTKLGSIGMMALFGVIIMSVVNIFMRSSGLDLVLSMVGLAIFIGLTAYDMQKIKDLASTNYGKSTTAIGLFGALQLYLDFVNIFLRLLRLFGKRR